MAQEFNNRVYGFAIIKSINSNYNADFSGQPRRLPNGKVYATDKVLKYSIRNYWKNALGEDVFYFKSLTDDMSPRTLDETYEKYFGKIDKKDKNLRKDVLNNILSVLDVRLFGGTYAGATNISVHGTCQITHGLNKFPEDIIYSEQIMSPFKNPSDKNKDSTMTTLGNQSKLEEGHYVHHFSINPKNIEEDVERVNANGLSQEDIEKLKEGLRKGVSFYDSASKSGTENEVLFWVQLKENSKLVMPSFIDFVDVQEDRVIDLSKVKDYLLQEHVANEIESIEIYYNKAITNVENAPDNAVFHTI
ncbi:CRISPR-associated protein [Flavobacteriaceae bacterium Ap0902]|nr:CRISPR-associated protein [Flavobacteriaceae bacterium Ap0902]